MTIATVPGLMLRPFSGEADLAALVRIANAENEADGIAERDTVDNMRAYLGNPSEQFDPARDVDVAELGGEIVGWASREWVDTREGDLREYRVWGAVDPAHRRRGIGTALLEHNEQRARALAAAHDAGRTTVFGAWAADGRPGSILLDRSGYSVVRWFFDMVRPSLDDLPDVRLPDGFELRPAMPDQNAVIWRANREAFRDHWGGSDESEAAMHRFLDAPGTDPSLWVIAWDGDEIAGGVINSIHPEENEALGIRRGWLDSVFTRRAWRRQGLARALIARSLVLLRDRGMTSAALGVDADNPSGALGLYGEAGFAVDDRFTASRKPMEGGPSS
ncbi:MAG: GNAT family N-acetyltransferase [Chloroflexota bacterium]|nr:GNAT family N-acetyltransferase [Chloroflexota bacterium]